MINAFQTRYNGQPAVTMHVYHAYRIASLTIWFRLFRLVSD